MLSLNAGGHIESHQDWSEGAIYWFAPARWVRPKIPSTRATSQNLRDTPYANQIPQWGGCDSFDFLRPSRTATESCGNTFFRGQRQNSDIAISQVSGFAPSKGIGDQHGLLEVPFQLWVLLGVAFWTGASCWTWNYSSSEGWSASMASLRSRRLWLMWGSAITGHFLAWAGPF